MGYYDASVYEAVRILCRAFALAVIAYVAYWLLNFDHTCLARVADDDASAACSLAARVYFNSP